MRFGGQQARLVQQPGQFRAAALVQAAQLEVSPGGEVKPAVAEQLGGPSDRVGLKGRQHSAGQPEPGEAAVVGGVQPQRSRTGVTTLPYGRFVPVDGWVRAG